MPSYKAPVEDVKFLLNDVFHIDRYANLPGFSDASPDVVEAILGESKGLLEDQILSGISRKDGPALKGHVLNDEAKRRSATAHSTLVRSSR